MGFVKVSIIIALLAAAFPFAIDFLTRHEYPAVNPHGGVLVTGASTGIGKHAAVTLANEGFLVFVGVRKEADGESLKKENKGIIPVILDVTKQEQIEEAKTMIEGELDKRGLPLSGLVNNAGVAGLSQPVEYIDPSLLRAVHDVNFHGALLTTQAFLPLIRKGHGRIINISSMAGLTSAPLMTIYCSSKWALEAFSDSLRVEMLAHNVSVSVVEPAYVKSEIFGKSRNEQAEQSREVAKELYGHLFQKQEYLDRCIEKASPPTVTSDAILHAIKSPYPKTRYVVADVDGKPASFLAWLMWLLPDRASDKLIMKMLLKDK